MPRLSGVFADLKNLESLPLEQVLPFLRSKIEPHILRNYIANRLIYPQTIASTKQEIEIDTAIIKGYFVYNKNTFYDPTARKIYIPAALLSRFGPASILIASLAGLVNENGVSQLELHSANISKPLGSIFTFHTAADTVITVNNKPFTVQPGVLTRLAFRERHLKIQLMPQPPFIATGGEEGLILDPRPKTI